jgi:transposase
MRRIADLYPGNAKTDARDAFIIADAAPTLPHALRRLDVGDDALAELDVLVGYDDDLASEATRISNRIRGLLTGIHPALERVLGPKAAHPAVLETLSRCGGPVGIRAAGRRRLTTIATKHAPRMGTKLVDNILTALDEQTVVVPGTTAADTVLPRLAESLKTVLQQRKTVAAEVEEILDAHPLAQVLTSMPGIGVRTAARILLEIGDASAFKSAGHLTAYAGIAPVTHHSGSSIRGEHPARSGNRKLKRAFFLAAFAALSDPTSRVYYDRKRAEARNTTPPSSASHDAAATSCSPCSAPGPPTGHPSAGPLDNHIGHPRLADWPNSRWPVVELAAGREDGATPTRECGR